MKKQTLKKIIGAALLSAAPILHATANVFFSQTFDSGFLNGSAISDGSLNGWSDSRTVIGASGLWTITNVQVTLNLSGGNNGDLYAYLAHGDGFTVLLNRVGVGQAEGDAFGYANAGMNITLTAGGAQGNIHNYGGAAVPSGAYQPDGRQIDPLSSPAMFDTAGTDANLGSFTGLNPNGQWTLFIADVVTGGGQSTAISWGLEVDAIVEVPEPGTIWVAALGLGLWRLRAAREKRSI